MVALVLIFLRNTYTVFHVTPINLMEKIKKQMIEHIHNPVKKLNRIRVFKKNTEKYI